MSSAALLRWSAVFGFLAVALGAFGAHGLRPVLLQHGTEGPWQTASLYHLVHAVAMLALARGPAPAVGAWRCFALGILIFSGSLYVLSLTGVKWLGAMTPIGGLLLLAGWALLARAPRSA